MTFIEILLTAFYREITSRFREISAWLFCLLSSKRTHRLLAAPIDEEDVSDHSEKTKKIIEENVLKWRKLQWKFGIENWTARGRRKAAACATHQGRCRSWQLGPPNLTVWPALELEGMSEELGRWMVEPKWQLVTADSTAPCAASLEVMQPAGNLFSLIGTTLQENKSGAW